MPKVSLHRNYSKTSEPPRRPYEREVRVAVGRVGGEGGGGVS